MPSSRFFQFYEEDITLTEGDHAIAALEPGSPVRSRTCRRFQNKIGADGNKLCNVCGSSCHLHVTCPARPNPVNELSMAIVKAYQLAVENGSAHSYNMSTCDGWPCMKSARIFGKPIRWKSGIG